MSAKPVAVMLRVSSDDQSHESQKLEVDRWLVREGIDPAKVEWYVETATGRNLDRPEFQRLEADIKARKRRTVVVYALDRISRDFFDGVAVLGRWLKAGVRVASVTESIDLSGEIGQALAGVIFALASAEWKKRKERQALGIEVAKSKGVRFGPEPGKFKGRRLKVAPEQEKAVKRMKGEGQGVSAIARTTGLSRPTVYSILAAD